MKFLTKLLLLILIGLPVSGQAMPLKIATLSPENSSWMKRMRSGAQEIARRTDNRVRFRFYPGGVMGDNKTVLRKIRIKQLHGGAFLGGDLARFYPDNQIYGMPLKFRSQGEVDYVRQQMDPGIIAGLHAGGFVSFGLAGGGFAYILSKRPITSLSELRLQKVWVPKDSPATLASIRQMEITPTPLSLGDVLIGLQKGLIDTVATSPMAAIALQWHTQVKYLTELPLSYFYALLAIDRPHFESLAPQDQKVVREVMREVFRLIDQDNRRDNRSALAALRQQGIQFLQPSPEQVVEWNKIAHQTQQHLLQQGAISQGVFQTLESHLLDYRRLNGHSRPERP